MVLAVRHGRALVDAGFRVIAPDQRGYSPGARPVGVAHYAMAHLVDDALALAGRVSGVDRVDVVGHDWGAAVGLAARGSPPGPGPDADRGVGAAPARLRRRRCAATPTSGAARCTWRTSASRAGRATLLGDGAKLAARSLVTGCPTARRYVERMREPGALTAALNWYRAQSLADMQDRAR